MSVEVSEGSGDAFVFQLFFYLPLVMRKSKTGSFSLPVFAKISAYYYRIHPPKLPKIAVIPSEIRLTIDLHPMCVRVCLMVMKYSYC